jgi:exo-beta-1,3-glucanase (GH17 family)
MTERLKMKLEIFLCIYVTDKISDDINSAAIQHYLQER